MKKYITTCILAILIMGTLFVWKIRYYQVSDTIIPEKVNLLKIPDKLSGWNSTDERLTDGVLSNLGVDVYIMRKYEQSPKNVVWLYVGYYRSQQQGGSIHSPLHCYPGAGWDAIDTREEEITIPRVGKTIRVRQFIVGKGDEREVVYYWYHERGRVIANEYASKIYQVYDSIVLGRNDGALVRFSMRSEAETRRAKVIITELIRELYPYIEKSIRG